MRRMHRKPKKENMRYVIPFNCNEAILMRFCGDIIASAASEYKLAGENIKKAKRRHEIGVISQSTLLRNIASLESTMKREKAFILSERFAILLGESRLGGKDVIQQLDIQIDLYDPYADVPDINPITNEQYTQSEWKKILRRKKNAIQ